MSTLGAGVAVCCVACLRIFNRDPQNRLQDFTGDSRAFALCYEFWALLLPVPETHKQIGGGMIK